MDTVLLKRIYVLVFIEHGTRRMHIGGVMASPTGEWTVQQARNLALGLDERLEGMPGSPGALLLINNLRVPVSPCGLCSPRIWQFSRDPA